MFVIDHLYNTIVAAMKTNMPPVHKLKPDSFGDTLVTHSFLCSLVTQFMCNLVKNSQ